LIVQCAVCVERIVSENISCLLRLLTQFRHALRSRLDERVKLLRRLAEYLHCDRVALGFIFHFAQRVDDLPVNRIAVAHIAFSVVNGNAEFVICLGDFVHFRLNGL